MKKLLIFGLLILFMGNFAGAPSRPHTYVTGNVIEPDECNSNENTLYNYLSAGVDTFESGSIINTDINASADIAVTKIAGTAATTTTTQTISGNKTLSGTTTASGTLNVSGTLQLDGTAVTSTATELNLLDGETGDVMTSGDAAGGDLTGTYPNPTLLTGIPQNIQVFTSSGTWTKPTGISTVLVKVWGAGGGGGADADDTEAGGGGGGGYSEGLIAVSGNVTVTIGVGGAAGTSSNDGEDGGTSSFAGDTTIQATGGGGGAGGGTQNEGTGGVGSGGTVNLTGSNGAEGVTGGTRKSMGGGSPMGIPGGNIDTAKVPGGGGSGGKSGNGDAGGAGLIIVYY